MKALLVALVAVTFIACGPKDAQITSLVKAQLETISNDIQVSTEKGVVTLKGEVDQAVADHDFMGLLKGIKGVKDVVNDLTVKAPVVTINPDQLLTDGMHKLLSNNANMKDVSFNIVDGEVNLTGSIKKDHLAGLIQAIHELKPKKVNNNLTVK